MKFVEPSHFTDPDAAARKLLEIANAKGWMVRHESGTYVKFTPSGAELFA
jgi:hypothetical protein